MLKQAENKVVIEGILSEVDIKTGVSKNTNKEYIAGEIKVKVDQDILGETKEIEIPISLYATKTTNAGGPNPAYEAISKIQNEYTSIAACGNEEEASRIAINRAELTENAFYGSNGVLVSMPRIRASFTQRIKADDCKPKATFQNTIVIGKIQEEIKNDEPTGRLIIKGIVPQYGEKVSVIDFIAASEESINHINTYWNEGDTVVVAGKVNFSSKTVTEEKSVGFGEPIIEERTISVRELIISSGSETALEGDLAYDPEDINKALKERAAYLESTKEKSQEKTKTASPEKKAQDFGF